MSKATRAHARDKRDSMHVVKASHWRLWLGLQSLTRHSTKVAASEFDLGADNSIMSHSLFQSHIIFSPFIMSWAQTPYRSRTPLERFSNRISNSGTRSDLFAKSGLFYSSIQFDNMIKAKGHRLGSMKVWEAFSGTSHIFTPCSTQ